MKTKILSVALAAFVVLIAFSCNQNAGSSGSPSKFKILAVDSVGEVGRYQLFNGTYRFFDYRNKKTENRQAVFLKMKSDGRVNRNMIRATAPRLLIKYKYIRVPVRGSGRQVMAVVECDGARRLQCRCDPRREDIFP